jgi:hypothetical protein
MEESTDGATGEEAPPAPPRWKGIQSLDLVHQLNERCVGLLYDVAASGAPNVLLPMLTENQDLWVSLHEEARLSLARMPFVIVDAKFRNAAWWRRAAAEQENPNDVSEKTSNGLSREASEHLMHETIMFAWQTARWDQTAAQISLGMAPSVINVIAALTPQQIRVIASRESQAVRIRWANDPYFWRDLLVAAKAGEQKRLATLHLHAKLLLCSEIAHLRE